MILTVQSSEEVAAVIGADKDPFYADLYFDLEMQREKNEMKKMQNLVRVTVTSAWKLRTRKSVS